MKHLKQLFVFALLAIFGDGQLWATDVTYKLTIDASDFNTTSYAANNNEKTSNAVCTTDNTKTYEVKWTSNQVMKNGNNMQWQKNNGYIYNSTDLGTITNITVTSSAGSFTTYYGTSEKPSSGTTVGNGYFQTKVGNATGTTSKVEVTFTISEGGGGTPHPTVSFAPFLPDPIGVDSDTFSSHSRIILHPIYTMYISRDFEILYFFHFCPMMVFESFLDHFGPFWTNLPISLSVS